MYKKNNRRTGTGYERKAGAYLDFLGYKIVTYNYRCRLGEIDLIARDGEYLVFVEVKYRTTSVSGYPAEAVDAFAVSGREADRAFGQRSVGA